MCVPVDACLNLNGSLQYLISVHERRAEVVGPYLNEAPELWRDAHESYRDVLAAHVVRQALSCVLS